MYRAVRYEKRYGFNMAPQTRALVPAARQHVGALSAQRIRHELDLILDEDQAAAMLRRLAALDLIRPIHAALPASPSILGRLEIARMPGAGDELAFQLRDSRWLLWLIELSAAQIRSIDHRLHFRRELLEAALAASALHRDSPKFVRWKPSRITDSLDKLPYPAIQAARQSATGARAKAVLQEYLTRWRSLRPLTTGKDLKGLGLAPGPAYRIILSDLRRSWLDGSITSAKEEHQKLETLLGRFPKTSKLGTTGPSLAKREL
jgi:tRNA nucleotidyltransferase (CCA-adding enzyme)